MRIIFNIVFSLLNTHEDCGTEGVWGLGQSRGNLNIAYQKWNIGTRWNYSRWQQRCSWSYGKQNIEYETMVK